MAISKKNTKKATEEKKQEVIQDNKIEVTSAKELENVIMFDALINGVKIYGMSYREVEKKDGSGTFAAIDFPSRKGNDGKWYAHAWVKLSDKDVDVIERGIEALIQQE